MPRIKFKITFKNAQSTVAVVVGSHAVDTDHLSVSEVEEVIVLEQKLEKLTGLRVHIESEYVEDLVEIGPRRRLSRTETLEKYGAKDENDI